jgi:hypothetical protein
MKRLLLFPSLLFVILLSSFNGRHHPARSVSAVGVYGVSSEPLPFTFELSLNADKTFHYVNNSVPGKAIDVTGTWEQKGTSIILKNYSSAFPINDKWKLDGDKCLKSRKGLEFTRLCNLSAELK